METPAYVKTRFFCPGRITDKKLHFGVTAGAGARYRRSCRGTVRSDHTSFIPSIAIIGQNPGFSTQNFKKFLFFSSPVFSADLRIRKFQAVQRAAATAFWCCFQFDRELHPALHAYSSANPSDVQAYIEHSFFHQDFAWVMPFLVSAKNCHAPAEKT